MIVSVSSMWAHRSHFPPCLNLLQWYEPQLERLGTGCKVRRLFVLRAGVLKGRGKGGGGRGGRVGRDGGKGERDG